MSPGPPGSVAAPAAAARPHPPRTEPTARRRRPGAASGDASPACRRRGRPASKPARPAAGARGSPANASIPAAATDSTRWRQSRSDAAKPAPAKSPITAVATPGAAGCQVGRAGSDRQRDEHDEHLEHGLVRLAEQGDHELLGARRLDVHDEPRYGEKRRRRGQEPGEELARSRARRRPTRRPRTPTSRRPNVAA